MVVKIINGMRIHSPPYTPRRRRMSSTGASAGALLPLRAQLVTVKSRRPQNSSSHRRQNRAALKSLLEPVIQPCLCPIILCALWTSSRGAPQ